MKFHSLGVAFVIALSSPAFAECSKEIRSEKRSLEVAYSKVSKALKRATVALRSQERRAGLLKEEALQGLEAPPVAPVADLPAFNKKGKIDLVCDDPAAAEDRLVGISDDLSLLEIDVDEFVILVAVREDTLLQIEQDAKEAAPPAEPPKVAESEEPEEKPAPETAAKDPEPSAENDAPAAEEDDGEEVPNEPETAEAGPEAEPEPELEPAETDKTQQKPEPLKVDGNPLVFQRILALPDARVVDTLEVARDAGAEDGEEIPPFTVLYVFDRKEIAGVEWAQVGPGVQGKPLGWTKTSTALAWNSALVMQFMPRGKRERVLFFDQSRDLVDVISDFQFASEAKGYYEKLDKGALKDERFVAAEPASAVDYSAEPYLLPIVDHIDEQFDDGTPVTLVKVASVSLKTAELKQRDEDSLKPAEPTTIDGDFRIGVTFVIDTTASMGPYIERTRETVRTVLRSLDGVSSKDSVSFGLVAYRDNLEHDPNVEYVTQIVQTLEADSDPDTVLGNIQTVVPSKRPTVDWREDAYAGIYEAIDTLDWDEFQSRIIVLITDAGAREGGDALASNPDLTTSTIVEAARAKNIVIFPIHLITKEAEELNQVASAAEQYRRLGLTGDVNAQKYRGVDARKRDGFTKEIEDVAREIIRTIKLASETPAPPAVNDGFITSDDQQGNEAVPGDKGIGDLVANEILRARLEYLGGQDEVGAPSFVSGWAASRDLVDPQLRTLEFSVFLTRNQINSLAQSVSLVLDAFVAAEKTPGAFFDELQLIAARTSRDPDAVRADEKQAIREILPAFLQGLPYLSEVLRLDRQLWQAYSNADRERFVDSLKDKLKIYERLYDQTENWVDFGANDPALEAYPLPLAQLP